MNTSTFRAIGLLMVASVSLATVACSKSNNTPSNNASDKITISVNGQPPKTQAFDRKIFDEDVAEFEATHPNIHIEPHEGFMDPKTFSAKLAGGKLEDVFYVYFTDPAQLIARHQAADITNYVKDVPHYADLQKPLKDLFTDASGHVYGIPTANYSMGLLYNRTLFTKAGLNPDQPPQTWDEVREAAKKISALGGNTVGFADYSKNNQGGWHFTTWMYSEGGQIATKDGDTWKAAFNNDKGRSVLNHLHQMRWDDNTMGEKQLLVIEDVQRMMGAGQLGMYIAAPDNVSTLVDQFKGKYPDYGVAGLPGGKGTLLGGEGYMINAKASPEKIKAGLTWLQWKFDNPDRFEKNFQRYKDQGQPVGLPVWPAADIWTGSVKDTEEQLKAKYATVPVQNYKGYMDAAATTTGHLEPPNAQQVYAALDNVMQAVLTNRDANFDQLLSEAETKVNTALAQAK